MFPNLVVNTLTTRLEASIRESEKKSNRGADSTAAARPRPFHHESFVQTWRQAHPREPTEPP